MAFSPNLPAVDAKIRDFPQQMQDNFTAIADGNSSFAPAKLHLTVQGGNPTLFDNTVILFSKDSSTESALFLKNDADDVIQMTDQEYLGGASQKIKAASIRFGSGTVDNNQNAMCTAWGLFTSNGTLTAGYNLGNCTHTLNSGIYTVNFSGITLANANYVAIPSVFSDSLNESLSINVMKTAGNAPTTTTFKVIIRTQGASPSVVDEKFMVIVFGGL